MILTLNRVYFLKQQKQVDTQIVNIDAIFVNFDHMSHVIFNHQLMSVILLIIKNHMQYFHSKRWHLPTSLCDVTTHNTNSKIKIIFKERKMNFCMCVCSELYRSYLVQ